MQFAVPGTIATFEIPDECWEFSGMRGFRPQAKSYALASEAFSGRLEIEIVPIIEITPSLERHANAAMLSKARIAPILLAIAAGRELPPVQLRRLGDHSFELVHGFHRYCASIAAGFDSIPGVFHEISWCRPGAG